VIRSYRLQGIPRPRRADGPAGFALVFGRLRGGSISPVAVTAIASAIQTQEGYAPGTLAYTNNNPGNLVYAGQAGATPGAGGFAAFPTYQAGLNALDNQITLDATRGTDVNGNPTTTLAQFITSYAPPSENNTAAYIANVSNWTGYDPNAPLSSLGAPTTGYTMDYGAAAVPSAPVASLPVTSSDLTVTDPLDLSDLSDLSDSLDLSSLGSSALPVYAVGALVLLGLFFATR
jgi:hypothetical protein